MRTGLLWIMIARIGYKDANMGFANAMSCINNIVYCIYIIFLQS